MTEITERLKVAIADRYVIERELGAGGMATVYLAHDAKHDRKVALKVLRPELAAVIGAERFLQEIKVTANLQHSHILPLYDSGAAESFLYYVMPYVEGETLRTKIDREKQLGVDDAVALTRAVAAALEHAHKQGVVHRDIKPENILLRDNDPLIADFGIALAVSHAGGHRLTETGLSIGTPHYMSPEQAMGDRELDARSDVYSLAAVLYEMLTGEPPYTGTTAQAIVARVITEEPRSITLQRRTVPPHVADAVHKALNKLPADRFSSAASFAEALITPGYTTPSHVRTGVRPAAMVPQPRWQRFAWPVVAGVLLVAGAWGWLRPDPPRPVSRYALAFAPGQELVDVASPTFALAPDASWIVYEGPGNQLWVKQRDQHHATPVPGSGWNTGSGSGPSVSPDGEWIAFTVPGPVGGQVRKVPRGGGSPLTIADSVSLQIRGVAWPDDGHIVYRDMTNRLRRVPDAGGPSEVVWASPEGADLRPRLPSALPGGRGVLFVACDGSCSRSELMVLDLRSGAARMIVPSAVRGWYVSTGHVVYARSDGGVFAAPFDLGAMEVTGPAVPVLEGLQVGGLTAPDFALSASGSLLMIAGPAGGAGGIPAEAVWVSRTGNAEPVDTAWRFSVAGTYGWALSPDNRRVAFTVAEAGGNDIWVKELPRGPASRLTTDPVTEIRPRWTPDGRSVSYIGAENDLFIRRYDGTLPPELRLDLTETIWEAVWSRDGSWLVVRVGGSDGTRDIWAQRIGTDTTAQRLLATDFDENAVALSTDGRWLAYQSDESGRDEVYVRPFPDISAGKWTVSLGGGTRPLWANSGRELFYVDGTNRLVAAQIRPGPPFEILGRTPLFSVSPYLIPGNYTPFDVTADDQRFLMVRRVGTGEGAPSTTLLFVENWIEELRARVRR